MKNENYVEVVVNGMICYITKQEFEELQRGERTWHDMFE